MFRLLCPNCKNYLNYQPLKAEISDKRKRCVYCGKNFTVKNQIIKEFSKR